MARYTDAVCKLCRREGEKLFLKGERCFGPKCAIERRAYPPGMHGQQNNFRRKTSDFGLQLREKQKARRIYGVLERQFRKYFEDAQRSPGLTGENLLRTLELRLDNVVYRLGFADSRAQARQLVNHGHVHVNGRRLDIPSALVSEGDIITVSDSSRNKTYFSDLAEMIGSRSVPSWLSLDVDKLSGRVNMLPQRGEIETTVNEQLIVEYYSR
ncbi:MAG: 30S ribosomal protein S4 [Anaerolineales bacterium]|nr:30S ribosomal protein S4 [Anaerolineales bacterium]MCB9127221.1 30S ribosomal protein S4 [Ardenticatenales bacterium]MCB9171977.1 30S ribosomal protein S4 [Ardenticatenales bacterium]